MSIAVARDRITQQQLESYLWGAAVLLRGTIDAGDYKQFIFPLLFYKRLCDVFDEETRIALKESGGDTDFAAFPENHRFQVPPDAHWREVRQVAKNVGHSLQSAMRAIETANPDKLYGIFGDAQWTNKDRLSDTMLRDLVEHFGTLDLTIANLPEDELGQGYEFLIKKFADDSGHTAAEFYTNRTVVHLMTEMLEPQPEESIYDPTCGSGGMLLSCIAHLRRQGKEWRNVKLFGQERNLMTSSIARMNCFLHGIEDFQIVRGDTLAEPKLVKGDHLMRFDVVLANPPYSIKQWNREAFASDPWGRNLYGNHRRAAPITRFGSTSFAVWHRKPAGVPFSIPMGCSSVRKKQICAESSLKRMSSSAFSVSGRTFSTTPQWKPASSSAAPPSPNRAKAASSLSTPSTRSRANAPRAFLLTTTLSGSLPPIGNSRLNRVLRGWYLWKKSANRVGISTSPCM